MDIKNFIKKQSIKVFSPRQSAAAEEPVFDAVPESMTEFYEGAVSELGSRKKGTKVTDMLADGLPKGTSTPMMVVSIVDPETGLRQTIVHDIITPADLADMEKIKELAASPKKKGGRKKGPKEKPPEAAKPEEKPPEAPAPEPEPEKADPDAGAGGPEPGPEPDGGDEGTEPAPAANALDSLLRKAQSKREPTEAEEQLAEATEKREEGEGDDDMPPELAALLDDDD